MAARADDVVDPEIGVLPTVLHSLEHPVLIRSNDKPGVGFRMLVGAIRLARGRPERSPHRRAQIAVHLFGMTGRAWMRKNDSRQKQQQNRAGAHTESLANHQHAQLRGACRVDTHEEVGLRAELFSEPARALKRITDAQEQHRINAIFSNRTESPIDTVSRSSRAPVSRSESGSWPTRLHLSGV
jgi:hypothetical protein